MESLAYFIKFLLFLQLSPYVTAQTAEAVLPPPPPANLYAIDKKFGLSMMIITTLIIFIMIFYAYFRKGAGTGDDDGEGGDGQSLGVARGLDVEVIKTFPTFVYSTVKGLKIGKQSLECAVCLNEFEDHDILRFIPKCGHVFHPHCINAWFVCQTTCPVCRADLVPKRGEISCDITKMFDSDSESEKPDRTTNIENSQNQILINVEDDTSRNVQSLDVNDDTSPNNQNRPQRSKPNRLQIKGKFLRSHSTGHSLIQLEENYERFTLRFSEEVRSEIMNSSLTRTKSCMAFSRVSSSNSGYRSKSIGSDVEEKYFNYSEWFVHETLLDRRGLSMTSSPFISRTSLVLSPKHMGANEEVTATPKASLHI